MNTNPWVQILGILNTFVKTKGLAISITSDIPINAGLGSSGSLALSLVAAVYHFVNGNPIKQSDLFETAKSIENIFHGKQGSGLDVAVSLNGGLVLYQKDEGFSTINVGSFPYKILIVDTGIRKESTSHAVEQVRQQVQAEGIDVIKQIGKITAELAEALRNGKDARPFIDQNQIHLKNLNLEVEQATNIIQYKLISMKGVQRIWSFLQGDWGRLRWLLLGLTNGALGRVNREAKKSRLQMLPSGFMSYGHGVCEPLNQYNQMQQQLPQRNNEVKAQYKERVRVYESVLAKTKDPQRAVVLSNLYVNIQFYGNKYEAALHKELEQFN